LKGPQFGSYEGQMVNITGSINLLFDQDNKLLNNTVKLIDNETRKEVFYAVELMILEMMTSQQVKEANKSGKAAIKQLSTTPELLSQQSTTGNFREVIKPAIIINQIKPEERGAKSLGDYFNKLKAQM
ncbi:MAG: hypothetical protein AB7V50_10740, partial [Vampirovibrionia bacterium]